MLEIYKGNKNGSVYSKMVGLVCGVLLMSSCGFETVDTGYRGVYTKFGEIQGEPFKEGLHLYNPFTSDIMQFDVKERALTKTASFFTKDTQHISVTFIITYFPNPDKIHNIYKQFGEDWEKKIIEPAALGTVRDVIGRYVADDIVSKLEVAKKDAEHELKENFSQRDVILSRLDFTEVNFDQGYTKSVEAKVIAIQKSLEAKNRTIEVEENAKQRILSAEAEAKSMTIRSQALSQNKGLVEYEAVQKWNGQLPTHMMGSSVPFINLEKK